MKYRLDWDRTGCFRISDGQAYVARAEAVEIRVPSRLVRNAEGTHGHLEVEGALILDGPRAVIESPQAGEPPPALRATGPGTRSPGPARGGQ